jgi:glycosyltransferase involved in cell wall biosynthesis
MIYQYSVSVRLMVYNHEHYIREAINGILIQRTNFLVEVVIGDDFSTDKSLEIIREYENTSNIHFKILERKEGDEYWLDRQKLGRLHNFYTIIKNCTGKYIALLDGDDYWTDPFKLQKQVDFLEKNNDYVVCSHDAKIIDSSGNIIKESKLPETFKKDATSDELKKGFWLLSLGMMFRNLESLKSYPKEGYEVVNGDIFFSSFLGQFGKSKYMDDIDPASYRDHGGGVWSAKTKKNKNIDSLNTLFCTAKYYDRINDKISKEIYLSCYIKGYWLFISGLKNNWSFSSQLKILKYTFVSFVKVTKISFILNGINKTFFLLLKKIGSFIISKIKHN